MSSWTLRRRLTVLFAGSMVLALVALTIGAIAFDNLLDARARVVDRADPAAVTERDLLAAMIDQETGVRGFTLTGDESFLEPYQLGAQSAFDSIERLRGLLGDDPQFVRDVDEVARLAEVWRTQYAEAQIGRVRLFGPGEPNEEELQAGRVQFDAVRSSLERLELELAGEREAARDDLDAATRALLGALVGIVAVVLLVGIAAWIAFNRWTLRPLERLAAGARIVASGDLHHELTPDGPPEITRLGNDVEAMRRRIAAEVATLEIARTELDDRARELARSNMDLEQFAYVASHDLQEPLRKVTSFCQLLQRRYEGQLDDRADQYIEFAVDGTRRMQTLINDLLTFSRVGRTTESFVPVDTSEVARRAAADLDDAVAATEGRIDIEPLPTVDGDPTLLLMLFRNLIGNAIKFRGEQPPVIEISSAADGDQWRFEFADNGIGIEAAYAEKVFVIFQRLHPRDEYEGTGIGLALAKKIVEFHGGEIWVDPSRHDGTAIIFTLPATKPHRPPTA